LPGFWFPTEPGTLWNIFFFSVNLVTKTPVGSLKKEKVVLRATMVLAVMIVTLVMASGVAMAVVSIGTPGDDTIRGTNGSD
jgi:hypothetical protein